MASGRGWLYQNDGHSLVAIPHPSHAYIHTNTHIHWLGDGGTTTFSGCCSLYRCVPLDDRNTKTLTDGETGDGGERSKSEYFWVFQNFDSRFTMKSDGGFWISLTRSSKWCRYWYVLGGGAAVVDGGFRLERRERERVNAFLPDLEGFQKWKVC